MQKVSFFDKTLLKKQIARFWPIYSAYFFLFAVIVMPQLRYGRVQWSSLDAALGTATVLTFVFGGMTALALFSYLYSAKSVTFYHALPLRRETIFTTDILVGLGFMVVPTVLIYVWMALLAPDKAQFDVFMWLCTTLAKIVFFYGFGVLIAMICGNFFAMAAIYGILNFAAVLLETLLKSFMEMVIPSYCSDGRLVTSPLSPCIELFRSPDGLYCAILAAVGVVCMIGALLLYRRRDLETASDLISVKALRPVFKYLFSLGCAVVLGSVLYLMLSATETSRVPLAYVCAIAGGAIGYFGVSMLMNRSFRLSKGEILGFVAFAAACTLLFACFVFDFFGVKSIVPEQFDEAYLTVSSYGTFRTEDGEITPELILDMHKNAVSEKLWRGENDRPGADWVRIRYYREGRVVCAREYYLDLDGDTETAKLIRDYLTSDRYIPMRYYWVTRGEWVYAYFDNYRSPEGYCSAKDDAELERIRKAAEVDLVNGVYSLTVPQGDPIGQLWVDYFTSSEPNMSYDFGVTESRQMAVYAGTALEKVLLTLTLVAQNSADVAAGIK